MRFVWFFRWPFSNGYVLPSNWYVFVRTWMPFERHIWCSNLTSELKPYLIGLVTSARVVSSAREVTCSWQKCHSPDLVKIKSYHLSLTHSLSCLPSTSSGVPLTFTILAFLFNFFCFKSKSSGCITYYIIVEISVCLSIFLLSIQYHNHKNTMCLGSKNQAFSFSVYWDISVFSMIK